ncbi:MAG: galactokinase family protein [Treponemataceae bacterium]
MQDIVTYHTYEYGDHPEAIATVPGRFHLLGEHLWFAHGDALSVAINKKLHLSVSKRPDNNFRIYSVSLDDRRRLSASNTRYRKEDRWANSVKIVISSFVDHGISISGLNFTVLSEIPGGASLGTPNALKVATGLVLRQLFAPNLSLFQLADIIEYANIQGLATYGHRSDIYVALFAKAGTCIRTEYKKKAVSHCKFPPDGYSIVLTDSKLPRSIARDELGAALKEAIEAYELVKKHPDAPKSFQALTENFLQENEIPEAAKRRVTYVIRESASIDDAVKALETHDNQAFTRLIARSQEGLRDRFEISAPELDWLVKRTMELSKNEADSLICARLTGKGFGGCTYSILKDEQVPIFAEKMVEYERFFGILPQQYIVKSSDGASITTSTIS